MEKKQSTLATTKKATKHDVDADLGKAKQDNYEDIGSCLQKTRFESKKDPRDKSAKLTTVEREKEQINSPYLFLSETEKVDIVKKKLEERRRKEVEEKAVAKKAAGGKGRSGFSMIKTDVTKMFNRKAHAEDRRREKIRKRTAAKYLKLILTGEQNEPELCPRIFAILLIWLIVVVSILGIVYFQTNWLQPFKILIGAANPEVGCFAEVKLYQLIGNDSGVGEQFGAIQQQSVRTIVADESNSSAMTLQSLSTPQSTIDQTSSV